MSARLSGAGNGLRPEHHLPAERSCRQAPPSPPRISAWQATEAGLRALAPLRSPSSSLSFAAINERRMSHETHGSWRRAGGQCGPQRQRRGRREVHRAPSEFRGEYFWREVEDDGGRRDGSLQDSARDASGLFVPCASPPNAEWRTARNATGWPGSASSIPPVITEPCLATAQCVAPAVIRRPRRGRGLSHAPRAGPCCSRG